MDEAIAKTASDVGKPIRFFHFFQTCSWEKQRGLNLLRDVVVVVVVVVVIVVAQRSRMTSTMASGKRPARLLMPAETSPQTQTCCVSSWRSFVSK